MAQTSKTTVDHDTIRRWVEERGGWAAEVEAIAGREGETGLIRIDIPGYSGEGKLRRISWDDWFRKLDEANLAFAYEEVTAGGQRSNFHELVARGTAEGRAEGARTTRRSAPRASAGTGARKSARGTTASRAAAKRGGAKRATAKRAGGRRPSPRAEAARTASRRGAPKRGSSGTRRSRRRGR